MTDKEKIRAEIERQLNKWMLSSTVEGYYKCKLCHELLSFVDSMQEEPKDKCKGCNNVKGCITCIDGSEWAHYEYTDENKSITQADSYVKAHKDICDRKEPVSDIDFEQELYKAFGQVKDFTLCLKIAKWFYNMGRNHQEPVSEELEEAAKKAATQTIGGVEKFFWNDYHKFKAGAKWQKNHLWRPADGDDLPEIDREVIAILDYDFGHYKVVYAHRPNPDGWNGTNIDTGEKEHFEPVIYDKGGWNQPHVLYWLDTKLPYEENKIIK